MDVYKPFSVRKQEQERAGQPDVYQYDNLPKPFRVQVTYIWREMLVDYDYRNPRTVHYIWEMLHGTLARELGLFELSNTGEDYYYKCVAFLMKSETDNALDIIELVFRCIDKVAREHFEKNPSTLKMSADEAIAELNRRFREHGIGYQYAHGEIIKISSEYVHQEAVRPALQLLHDHAFAGASEEFMKAHEHYRHGRNKEAIAEALKAFESTMRTICDLRRWTYKSGPQAKDLIEALLANDLIPSELNSHFTGIRTTLESGLPTVRNKKGGHGQGKDPVVVPDYLASYALHLAATNIVFLVEAHKAKP